MNTRRTETSRQPEALLAALTAYQVQLRLQLHFLALRFIHYRSHRNVRLRDPINDHSTSNIQRRRRSRAESELLDHVDSCLIEAPEHATSLHPTPRLSQVSGASDTMRRVHPTKKKESKRARGDDRFGASLEAKGSDGRCHSGGHHLDRPASSSSPSLDLKVYETEVA
ncbi:uncharacterized protein K489DRAFT_210279 [Dissoconium aciculare CBS 342.82]|uniref:Uncharacterized protein n=1 Tax=Dissoconium aciculare CBS 342.82 TaxID=1314786 RepID=A0A6J3MAM9_9PEZI|nr:uncharacterized protein K489DRAFT_210279 [Dissoconium aciculare CBS 342.82]KAF1823882.1 hypothetical protein K489DRAFT_210279 [Dissoconium aciculare CBS 342.82]